ncbi:hypothetical protein Ahy_A04g020935 [Arachis hypogaea]|uniref:UBN2 domain-containing protein n=1 Tax=Arachis hypogaea TaxID=3818 RepID=A0A445DIX1_ARAHY|nr:hypothetical protein Ahy_A04g020935 [Arachis hypogaea]
MTIWIKSQDMSIWDVTKSCNFVPKKITTKKIDGVDKVLEEAKPKLRVNGPLMITKRLVHEYELFQMMENKKNEDMFGRFSNIITNLNLLGRKVPERDVVSKILRSLTPQWDSKVNVIQEGRNFEELTYD